MLFIFYMFLLIAYPICIPAFAEMTILFKQALKFIF